MANLYPIGSEIVAEGFLWKVVGHTKNSKGQPVEDLEPIGPAPKAAKAKIAAPAASPKIPPKPKKIPRRILIAANTYLNLSRKGVSMSMQIAPGLSITMGKGGARLNVNFGPVRYSRKLK